MMELLTNIISNTNLKTLSIPAKRLASVGWLGPGRVSGDGYITVLEIQTEIFKDGKQVKLE